MNKSFFIFLNTLLLLSLLTFTYAWDNCPYGITNSSCTFPGECNKYIDTNNNNICDRSEPAPNVEQNSPIITTTNSLNINVSENTKLDEDIIDKYVPTPSSELKNYTILEVSKLYNISPNLLIEKLKLKINEVNNTYTNYNNNYNEITLTEEIIDEYINISGSKLKTYTIKEICNIYNINSEDLKEKLGINVPDDTTFDTIKKEYGISPSKSKEAIVKCLLSEGKIKLDYNKVEESNKELELERKKLYNNINENTTLGEIKEVYGLSPTQLKEAILECMIDEGKIQNNIGHNEDSNNNYINSNNTSNSLIDIIIKLLFGEINLKELFNIFK